MNNSRLYTRKVSGNLLLPMALFSMISFQSVALADTSYGPIRAGETLSSIVNENYLISSFSDQVIMQEIFRKNPDAFIYNRMGLLKQGVTLILPSEQTIAASRPASARVSPTRVERQVVPEQQNNTEIQTLESQLVSVRAERRRVEEKLRQLEIETISLTARVTELESMNAQLSRELISTDDALEAARAELREVQNKAKTDLANALSSVDNSSVTEQTVALGEKDARIKSLESSIAQIQDEQASELLSLKTSLEAKGAEQQALEAQVKVLTDSATQFESEIVELRKKNESLVVELTGSQAAYDELKANSTLARDLTGTASTAETNDPNSSSASTQAGSEPFDITTINSQNLSSQLEKPVTFPLWGLLLGSLALALTTLLMFMSRGRAQKAAVVPDVLPDNEPDNNLVFKAADPDSVEPSIDELRVAPRRDPARVAILDPTMNDQIVAEEIVTKAHDPILSERQLQESELKLAMAEAYNELGDLQAASELLVEVSTEGGPKQAASAQSLLNRLVG